MPFAQPLWSVDRDLAQAEVVRSSVYSYFINDDMIANKTSTETKNAAGETVTTDSVIFSIPPVAYGALNTEHLEFSHFVRLEVVLPGLMSSNRSVTMDIPVQMMTCEMHTAARFLSRRGSIPNIERKMDSDASSMLSGKSNSSGGHHSTHTARNATLSADTQASIMSSLPVRYCDIPPEQRPAPLLTFVNQLNVNPPASPVDDQARSMRNQTMSSMHSFDARTSSSGHSGDEYKEKYRTRPLPMAPSAGGAPPPLPAEPMPSSIPMAQQPPSAMSQQGPMPRAVNQTNIDVYQQSMRNPLVLAPYSPANSGSVVDVVRGESPIGGASSMVPDDSYMLASTKMRQHHQLTSRLHTPISPLYGGPHDDGLSDSEASYFREASRHSMERDAMNDAMFRAHQSSSINHYH
ncbi:hypothetical protein H4R19_004510 [Coemansia spiralis]|nr:hypothetical protein H4R19_004510 [Coemansia spiralis]